MAARATFALKAGVWFRRGRLVMVSPDSQGTACPLSGRNSTYRPVQISGTGSVCSAFILGVLKGIDYHAAVTSAARKPCFANYVPPDQAQLIVEKFMRDHPEQLGYDAGMVAA